jgi:aspartyl-tRNA(Asn)/glutamyl-tRNA(Gln) amidotransferase subunit A
LFSFSSIEDYIAQLKEGKHTCEQVVDYYLKNIDSCKELNAFTAIFFEDAKKRAAELDQKRKASKNLGKLHGVIIGIKDNICYKNHLTTAGSKMLEGYNAIYTATAVQRLLDEEAIIIGSLNCDEFGMGSTNENSFYGRVKHPIDPQKVPGGSSGGSAAAVKANCCMIALGSDTGGSVRQPADWCGLVGLKPTYGRISRYGLIAYASSFDQIGIIGNTVEDCALLLEIMAGPDEFDSTAIQKKPTAYSKELTDNQPLKITFFEEAIHHPSLDKEIKQGIENLLANLTSKGHLIKPTSFSLLDFIVPTYYVLTTAEASSNLSRYDGVRFGHQTKQPVENLNDFYEKNRSEGFGAEVKRRIMLGSFVLSAGYQDAYFTKAQQVRRLLSNQLQEIFEQFDVLIMPTTPTTAFNAGEKKDDPVAMYVADIYTVLANLVGSPAISIPLAMHSNGMPFGLQLIAGKEKETTLLKASKTIFTSIQK